MPKRFVKRPFLRLEYDQWDFWTEDDFYFVKLFLHLFNLPLGSITTITFRMKQLEKPKDIIMTYLVPGFTLPPSSRYENPKSTTFLATAQHPEYQEAFGLGCTKERFYSGGLTIAISLKKEVIGQVKFRIDHKQRKPVRTDYKGIDISLITHDNWPSSRNYQQKKALPPSAFPSGSLFALPEEP